MDVTETGVGVDDPQLLAGIASALKGEDGAPEPEAQAGAAPPEQAEKPEAEAQTEAAADDNIEIDPDAPLFEIQVAGEDGKQEAKKLSLTDLQNSYSEREQLRVQNQELSRAAGAVEQKVRETVTPIVERYQQNLQILQNAVWKLAGAELADVDMDKLAETDPAEAVRLSHRAQKIQSVLQAAQQEIGRITQEQQEKAQAAYKQQAVEAVAALKRDIPGWGQELYSTVLKTGVDAYGFSPDEVNAVVDQRMIKVLLDAHKYRQLQAAKPNLQKRVVSVPKMLKPGASQEDTNGNGKAAQIQARFKKSGRVEDMAALLLATGKG